MTRSDGELCRSAVPRRRDEGPFEEKSKKKRFNSSSFALVFDLWVRSGRATERVLPC